MVFRVTKTQDYTVMSNFHLREKEMSLKAKGLLSWMLSNTDDWDYSIAGIVANCKENETAIESALDELKLFGYLTVTKCLPNETKSGRIEYIYDIHERPVKTKQEVEKQGVDFLGVEFLGVEKQEVENSRQRSTIERSTKEERKNKKTILKDSEAEPLSQNISNNEPIKPKRNLSSVLLNSDTNSKSYNEDGSKRLNLYDKCVNEINNYTQDEELRSALKTYLTIRLGNKDKRMYGVGQWKGMLSTLDQTPGNKLAIVQKATERGWASFYELKDYKYKDKKDVFAEDYGVKSVKPTEVKGGNLSGQIF